MRALSDVSLLSGIPVVSHSKLGELVAALDGITPDQWKEISAPDSPNPYSRLVLVDTPELQIVAARWHNGARSELHGHGDSAGCYRVVQGFLEEERFVPGQGGYAFRVQQLAAGGESFVPAGAFHQLRAKADSISLHAYSPRPSDATSQLTEAERQMLHTARCQPPTTAERRQRSAPYPVHRDIQQLAEKLAGNWGQYEAQAYRDGGHRVPWRVLEEMRSSGILALPIPSRLGGSSATLLEAVDAVSTIAQQAPAAALALVMPLGNAATCTIPLSAVPREQASNLRANQGWIAERVRNGRIFAVANSEPGAGGKLSDTKTLATRGPDGIVRLTGKKTFATIGPDADYFLVAARTSAADRSVIDGYFVHREAPGLQIGDQWDPLGMRPTASVALFLDEVPAEQVLGYWGCLEGVNARHWSTLLFSAVFLGIGQAALREGVAHVSGDWARAKLAEQVLAIDAARGYLQAVAMTEEWPASPAWLQQVQQVKTFVTSTVVQVATQVAMLSGGRCYSAQHPVHRLLADALAGPLLRPPVGSAMDAILSGFKS